MIVPFVDLKPQYLSLKSELDEAIRGVLEDCSFVGGSRVKNFENEFAKLLGVKHCIGVGNGTDALYIILKMVGLKPGDEVITSVASWISTSETISQTGAKPVFVDIDPDTYTMNPLEVEKKITQNTKAILPVHLYGHVAHVSALKAICEKYHLTLIEDCAQSHFTEENEKLAGTFGIAGAFSFYPGKNLGAYGDAGAIVTNDDDLAQCMRMYANHGALEKHQHEMEGINSRLDTMQAAILSVKAKYILKWTDQRIANATKYDQLLEGVSQIIRPSVRSNTKHTFHLYVIRTDKRNELKAYLASKGIETSIHYPKALPNLPAYKHFAHLPEDFPVASKYQDQILSLPMYPELTSQQIEYVSQSIKNFFA